MVSTPRACSGFSPNRARLAAGQPFGMVRPRGSLIRLRGASASMSRVSVAERIKLTVFLARGLARKLVNRLTGLSLIRLPLPGKADRLVIAPQDLRTSDATRASEIYSGRFVFAGKVVIC